MVPVGLSTSLYNPGQKYYFSPIGYIFKFTEEKSVLANFRGDGSIGAGPYLRIPCQNMPVYKYFVINF